MNASSKLLANLKDTFKSEEPLIPEIKRHILRKIEEDENTRRTDVLHPSAMSDPYWCPRHDYYGMIDAPKSVDTSTPSFQMEMVYDYGNRIHTKYQTWLTEMGVLWGEWECSICTDKWIDVAPSSCFNCALSPDGPSRLKYLEVPLAWPEMGIAGHADGVVIGESNRLIEIKSIGLGSLPFENPQLAELYANGELTLEQIWFRINRPFAKHLRQGQIYLALIREAYPDLNINEMVFIYEWKPNQAVKSFLVSYNPAIVGPLLRSAEAVQEAMDSGTPPARPTWANDTAKTCEGCDYRDECYGRQPTESKAAETAARRVRRADAKKRKRVLGH